MPATVLLIDSDDRLAGALSGSLRRRGYGVLRAASAAAARAAASAAPGYDAVLLDPALPDGDGLGMCARLRGHRDAAVIVLAARAGEHDRVRALRAGADDCLGKPFGIGELHARLDAVLRRRGRRAGTNLAAGRLRVDLEGCCAYVDGVPVRLSHKELHLLAVLTARSGAVVTRQRLAAEVWNVPAMGRSRTLDVHVATLRTKVRAVAAVENVRGVGYRLVVNGSSPEPP